MIFSPSGHKNVQSVNNYSHLNKSKHKRIASLQMYNDDAGTSTDQPLTKQQKQTSPRSTVTATHTRQPTSHTHNCSCTVNNDFSVSTSQNNITVNNEENQVENVVKTIFQGPIYGGNLHITFNR